MPPPLSLGAGMRRREFLGVLASAAANFPLAVRAQQAAMPVIGFFHLTSLDTTRENLAAFRRGLAETGYIEHTNVAIEYRWAEGQNGRLPTLVAELVRRQVSVIVVLESTNGALAAKAATQIIPIVFMQGVDPVQIGLVKGLDRPGGISPASTFCWQRWPESAFSCCSNWCQRPSLSLTSAIRPTPFMRRAKPGRCRLRRA